MRTAKLSKLLALLLLSGLITLGATSFAMAKPRLNAPRAKHEPGWTGPTRLSGTAKAANRSVPILERSYRPFHVYGNMTRRHHYRGTIIPSHRDRTEMLQAMMTKKPVPHKYVTNRYK